MFSTSWLYGVFSCKWMAMIKFFKPSFYNHYKGANSETWTTLSIFWDKTSLHIKVLEWLYFKNVQGTNSERWMIFSLKTSSEWICSNLQSGLIMTLGTCSLPRCSCRSSCSYHFTRDCSTDEGKFSWHIFIFMHYDLYYQELTHFVSGRISICLDCTKQ